MNSGKNWPGILLPTWLAVAEKNTARLNMFILDVDQLGKL